MERESIAAMEKKVSLSWLLVFYGDMLTENQREIAHLYWEEDLTLAEIAQQFSISRQSVHDTLSRTEKQLETLEEKMGLLRRFRQVEEGLQSAQRALSRVNATPDTQSYLREAQLQIAKLMDQEEQ